MSQLTLNRASLLRLLNFASRLSFRLLRPFSSPGYDFVVFWYSVFFSIFSESCTKLVLKAERNFIFALRKTCDFGFVHCDKGFKNGIKRSVLLSCRSRGTITQSLAFKRRNSLKTSLLGNQSE